MDFFVKRMEDVTFEDFCSRFSVPFLLVEKKTSKSTSSMFRTVSPEEDTVPLNGDPVSGNDGDGTAEHLFVFTVEKSGKNAFKNMITVGRSSNNDVMLESLSVSKLHGFFKLQGEGYSFTDVGSTNGTFIDEKKLSPNEAMLIDSRQTLVFGGDLRGQFFQPGDFHEYMDIFRRL
jgi:hypothetical protein